MTDPSCHGDLTDADWLLIDPLVSKPPATAADHDLRLAINGIFLANIMPTHRHGVCAQT